MRYWLLSLLLFCASATAKPVTITLWHSLAGGIGNDLQHLVTAFNKSQHKYRVKAVYKGTYSASLTSLVAAFRAHKQPVLAQVFEVGTATMIRPKGIVEPIYQLFGIYAKPRDLNDFIPVISKYYSDKDGRMLGFPFNSSTPVMFYDKNAFVKAGLNPARPPRTWQQLGKVAAKLHAAGYNCGFTSSWPSWIQLEEFSDWNNIPFATKNNGFSGYNVKLLFNNPKVINHIKQLYAWQQTHQFCYGGRQDNPQPLFVSHLAPILMTSSGAQADLNHLPGIKLGVAPLPYVAGLKGAPQNTAIGGGALWVMSGFAEPEYKAAVAFLRFLMQAKNQLYWLKSTGYLPTTKSGFSYAKSQGFYKRNPQALIVMQQLTHKKPKPYTVGLRLGNYMQLREVNAEALEAVWSGDMNVSSALNRAVRRGDKLLHQFYMSTGIGEGR